MDKGHLFLTAPELILPVDEFAFAHFMASELAIEPFLYEFPTEKMLGKQAEYLFEEFIRASKRYELIASNIQIQGITETIGELDYIVFDTKTNKHLHIELACKFYVLDKSLGPDTLSQCIGPNRKDRLVDKLEKLTTKQFPLLYRSETASFFKDLNLNVQDMEQQLCLKVFLFVPTAMHKEMLPQPYQNCIAGRYIKFDSFDLEATNTALYAFPQKKEWLLPPAYLTDWMTFSEAKEEISIAIRNKRSPLVYIKSKKVIQKLFVLWW